MMKLGLCGLVALVASTSAIALEARIALEDDVDISLHSVDWNKGPRADPTKVLSMTFAVKQQNIETLKQTLLRTSDPDHQRYGEHLTKDAVDQLVAPSTESVAVVKSFLADFKIDGCDQSASSDFFVCDVPVGTAERMLNVEYYSFSHKTEVNTTVVRAANHYSVPSSVAQHLDLISTTNRFPGVSKAMTKPEVSEPLRTNVPDTLRTLYSVGDAKGSATDNRLCCTAFLKQHYLQKDLDKFWKKYFPSSSGQTITVVGPDGGFPGIEASLDIQYISTMGADIPAEFWSFAGTAPDNKENEPFLTWIYLVGNYSDAKVPKVFSTSYGEPESTVSMAYMYRIENEFVKTGARGISLFFASGDSGVANDDGSCSNGRFAGQWPAGSPWVTGVGGTEGGSTTDPEMAWSGSSGGFSDKWLRADFQSDDVAKYLAAASLPDSSHFNSTGRGFPDVSAQATSFTVINDGFPDDVAGTSCASPTFTGIFALLNDIRLKAGKPTLGFANPLFYKNQAMFNDITSGSNPGNGAGCGSKGFEAIKGWDPVTGLGTPNYAAMAKVVAALP